jgi:hypothetical protein
LVSDETKLNEAVRTLKEFLGEIKNSLKCPFLAENY